MMRAQLTWNLPAGNAFSYVPGITTDLDGITPATSTGLAPETSMIRVEEVVPHWPQNSFFAYPDTFDYDTS